MTRMKEVSPEQVNRTSHTPNQTVTLDLNDLETWPVMCDKLRYHLIESTCLDRGKNANIAESESEDGRRFSPDWFAKTLANGEKVERKWMLYSTARKALYCLPCMMFGKQTLTTPGIANSNRGFHDWRHLYTQAYLISKTRRNIVKITDVGENLNFNYLVEKQLMIICKRKFSLRKKNGAIFLKLFVMSCCLRSK